MVYRVTRAALSGIIIVQILLGVACLPSAQSLAFNAKQKTVSVVTGANGYVGRAVVESLLETDREDLEGSNDSEDGHHTIYCLVRERRIAEEAEYWSTRSSSIHVLPYDMLDGGASIQKALEQVYAAKTNNDGDGDGEEDATDICVYHIASSFGPTKDHVQTANENVKGTEDLVRTVGQFPNCKLVLTSSMAAVRGSGQIPLNGKCYTNKDWNTISNLGDNWGSSYQWSKAQSEQRAWDIAKELGVAMTTICPAFVFGPPPGGLSTSSYSITLVRQWSKGESQVQSRLCVDVRDVALAHVRAGRQQILGQRYIVSRDARVTSQATAEALRRVCVEQGVGNADSITFDAEFAGGSIPIGEQEVDAEQRLKEELGVELRSVEDTMSDMCRALLDMEQNKSMI